MSVIARIPIALVLVMVLTATIAPVAGATTTEEDTKMNGDCWISPTTGKQVCSDPYSELTGQTTEEVWLSMHIQSEAMHDRYTRYTVEKASISNLTTGMMTEEGTVAFIQAYNNGDSVADAKLKGVTEVNDMSSGWQASVAYEQTAQAERVRVMKDEANGTGGMTIGDVFVGASHGSHYLKVKDGTLTLYNGSVINITRAGIVDTYHHNNEPKTDKAVTYYDGNYTAINETMESPSLGPLNVRGPESVNGSTVFAMDSARTKWTLDTIDANRKVAIDNVQAFADSYAAQYDRGEVSAEEFMSPSYRMRNHATDYESTGHYAYLMFAAQDRGMAVDVETGFTVDYTHTVANASNVGTLASGETSGDLWGYPTYDGSESTLVYHIEVQDADDGSSAEVQLVDHNAQIIYTKQVTATPGETVTVEVATSDYEQRNGDAYLRSRVGAVDGNVTIGSVTLAEPTQTIDGGLYAQPGTFATSNGTIETGVRYNTNDLNGSVWTINAKNSEQTLLDGTFVITEMRDIDDGTTVNQTTLQDNSFATRDADGFKNDVKDWQTEWDRQQEIEQEYNISSEFAITMPWDDAGGTIPDGQSVALVIGLFLAVLFAVGFVINAVKPY